MMHPTPNSLWTVSLALVEYEDPKWLEITHWYLPSLENSTFRSCNVVVYSVTSVSPPAPPCTRRWAWLWISASLRTSLSFFQAKVIGESLELAAEHTNVTLAPLRADWVSGCTVIWGFGKSSVWITKRNLSYKYIYKYITCLHFLSSFQFPIFKTLDFNNWHYVLSCTRFEDLLYLLIKEKSFRLLFHCQAKRLLADHLYYVFSFC